MVRYPFFVAATALLAACVTLGCGDEAPSPESLLPATPTATPTLPPPPALLGLEGYQKYLDADGIAVVSSARVPDEALYRVAATIGEMLADSPEIREAVVVSGGRVTVLAEGQPVTEIPEFRYWSRQNPDWTTFDGRAMSTVRGLGPTLQVPVTIIGEELVLCYPDQQYRQDALVHEIAHMVFGLAVAAPAGIGGFRQQVGLLLTQALHKDLWVHTYAATNADEYWAVAVQAWFDVGGSANGVDTRQELLAYDPAIARLVREVFGDATLSSSCHLGAYGHTEVKPYVIQGVVVGPHDEPLPGLVLWAFKGSNHESSSWTGADGSFALLLGSGEFDIALCTTRNGQLVFGGWYSNTVGVTQAREKRTAIVVGDESIADIVIKLPPNHGITACLTP